MTIELLKYNIIQEVTQFKSEWVLLKLKQILKELAQEEALKSEDIVQKDKILISKINQTALSLPKIERCNVLLQQMELSTLTADEHQELMALVEEEETLRTVRVKYLIELAQLRNITLPQLMENLVVQRLHYCNSTAMEISI
jgi:hypothetical protein